MHAESLEIHVSGPWRSSRSGRIAMLEGLLDSQEALLGDPSGEVQDTPTTKSGAPIARSIRLRSAVLLMVRTHVR